MYKQIFVIAKIFYKRKDNADFVCQLSHNFAGEKDVLGFNNLRNALSWETKEKANKILAKQPKWVKESLMVIPVWEFAERKETRTLYNPYHL